MQTFSLVFLAALALATAAKLWLAMRHLGHIRRHRDAVPVEFSGDISLEAHQKAADYICAKTSFGILGTVFECALILVLTFGGGLQWLHDMTAGWFAPGIARDVAFVVLFGAVMTVLDIPFDIYRTFVIEERFGFNQTTPRTFVADQLKNIALMGVLMVPLIACLLWLMDKSGQLWWLYAWVVVVAFSFFVQFIGPTWIAPLFNKFSPLEDTQIRERIERLLDRCGFKLHGVMVMDGSRRSSHTNAHFTGFGKTKRIVFFDTLLKQLTPAELEAVLAHELGHFKLKHIFKRLAWGFATFLLFFWLLAQLMSQPWFFNGLGVATPSTAMALVLFFVVLPQFIFLLHPLTSHYSRKHEFEADRYATENTAAPDMIRALVKLYNDNAATLTPDPLHSMFYDSHPPATLRIARLQAIR